MRHSSDWSITVYLPLTLIGLALAVYLAAQIGAASRSSRTMRWQLENLDVQIQNLEKGQEQLEQLLSMRENQVKQAEQIKGQYSTLLQDMLVLAETDADTRKVVEKWGIRQTQKPDASKARDSITAPFPATSSEK